MYPILIVDSWDPKLRIFKPDDALPERSGIVVVTRPGEPLFGGRFDAVLVYDDVMKWTRREDEWFMREVASRLMPERPAVRVPRSEIVRMEGIGHYWRDTASRWSEQSGEDRRCWHAQSIAAYGQWPAVIDTPGFLKRDLSVAQVLDANPGAREAVNAAVDGARSALAQTLDPNGSIDKLKTLAWYDPRESVKCICSACGDAKWLVHRGQIVCGTCRATANALDAAADEVLKNAAMAGANADPASFEPVIDRVKLGPSEAEAQYLLMLDVKAHPGDVGKLVGLLTALGWTDAQQREVARGTGPYLHDEGTPLGDVERLYTALVACADDDHKERDRLAKGLRCIAQNIDPAIPIPYGLVKREGWERPADDIVAELIGRIQKLAGPSVVLVLCGDGGTKWSPLDPVVMSNGVVQDSRVGGSPSPIPWWEWCRFQAGQAYNLSTAERTCRGEPGSWLCIRDFTGSRYCGGEAPEFKLGGLNWIVPWLRKWQPEPRSCLTEPDNVPAAVLARRAMTKPVYRSPPPRRIVVPTETIDDMEHQLRVARPEEP